MALKKSMVNRNAGLAPTEVMTRADILTGKESAFKKLTAIPRQLIAFHENNDYRELDNDDSIRQLANAIKRQGLLDNLVVVSRASKTPGNEDKKFVLLSGERRLRAINLICKEDPDYEPQYATLMCNVLSEDSFKLPEDRITALHENGYADDKIRDIQEMIVIDEANLQRRGGVGDEKQQRKAAIRYSNNLEIIYGISRQEADELTKRISGQSSRSTEINLKLERDLIEPLRTLLDKSILKKADASRYCALPVVEQEAISSALSELASVQPVSENKPTQEFMETSDAISKALQIRNQKERETAFYDAIHKGREIAEQIKRDTKAAVKKKRMTQDKHTKLMNDVLFVKKRIQSLGKKSTIEDIARDEILNNDGSSVAQELGRVIADMQELQSLLNQEIERIRNNEG